MKKIRCFLLVSVWIFLLHKNKIFMFSFWRVFVPFYLRESRSKEADGVKMILSITSMIFTWIPASIIRCFNAWIRLIYSSISRSPGHCLNNVANSNRKEFQGKDEKFLPSFKAVRQFPSAFWRWLNSEVNADHLIDVPLTELVRWLHRNLEWLE